MLDRVAAGDHVCWVVDDDIDRTDTAVAFLRTGLAARQQVIYSGDEPAAVLAALSAAGVDTAEALRARRLQMYSTAESHLPGGYFDAEATIKRWRGQMNEARAEGYPAIRIIGDMTWAAGPVPGVERVGWYEAQVNELFADGFMAGVCTYDRRAFDPIDLRRLSMLHPGAAGPALRFDPASSLRLRSVDQPYGLRLTGEADLASRAALAVVLDRTFADADGRVVTVDVSGLRFTDTAAARLLVRAAEARPGRLRLVGCSAALVRLLAFHGAGEVSGSSGLS